MDEQDNPLGFTLVTRKDPIKPTPAAIESMQNNINYWAVRAEKAENALARLKTAARPFADHDWMDAGLEDDNCKLTRHSGPITVGHWRALRVEIYGPLGSK